MPTSLESARPIMTPSVAPTNRMSSYSMQAPSLTGTIQTTDSTVADIRTIATGLERMENPVLSNQRVSLTEKKTDDLKKLALGAKLDRALERRMVGQDAVMRPRNKSFAEKEKIDGEEGAEAEANGTTNPAEADKGEPDGRPESAKANTHSTEETVADGHHHHNTAEGKTVDDSSVGDTDGDGDKDAEGDVDGDGDYVTKPKV